MSIENFGEALPALNRKTAERKISAARVVKPLRFEVRYDSAGVRFVNACCDKMQPKRRLFSGSRNECFDMIMHNHDELVANWEAAKLQSNITEDCIRGTEQFVSRYVVDDITPEMIMSLGVKGVEWGKWVLQDERQELLNLLWISMTDLESVTGVDSSKWFENLHVCLGSRGSGIRAAAHYSQANSLINLTRMSGKGALAHELAHHWDKDIHTLPKIPTWDKRCARADSVRGKPYWSLEREKFARAFEFWVKHKLAERGIVNDFLVNIVPYAEFSKDKDAYVYPLFSEWEVISDFFDGIFGELK